MVLCFWRTYWLGIGRPLENSAKLIMGSKKTSLWWTATTNHSPPLSHSCGFISFFSVSYKYTFSLYLSELWCSARFEAGTSCTSSLAFFHPRSGEKNRGPDSGSYGSPSEDFYNHQMVREAQLLYMCVKQSGVYPVCLHSPLCLARSPDILSAVSRFLFLLTGFRCLCMRFACYIALFP